MRPVLALAALGVLVAGSLAACSDDDPVRLPEGNRASFSLRPQLNSFGASQMLPINVIRLTVLSLPDSVQLMDPVEETVDPEDPSWSLHLDVPLEDGEPVQVIVLVELINETGGVRTVEWSGVAGPFDLEPGQTSEPPVVDLFRGGLDNLSITAVFIEDDIDTSLLEDETLLLEAFANGATGVPQFFWSSLAPTVAEVDTAGGDSAVIRALLPGVARIVVEAGQHADTIQIDVGQRIASIVVGPANDTVDALDAQALFAAQALDPRGDPVPDVFFDWLSSDTLVARHTEGGSFRAMGVGTATITASTAAAPAVTGTASLTVRQVVTSLTIAQADTTLGDGETLALGASAADANGFGVAGAPITWSSSDDAVASVSTAGLVTANSIGTARIRAASGTAQDSVTISVAAGPVASVDVQISNDTIPSGATASASAQAFDAQGNPVAGATFTWSSADPAVASVDAAGMVTAATAGSTFIRALSAGFADSVQVVVVAGPPATMILVSGDDQSGTVNTVLGTRLVVRIDDAAGNRVQGVDVTWSGDGSFAPALVATNVNGRASTDWTLGTLAGAQTASATAGSLSVTFSASAAPGAVDSVDVAPDSVTFSALGQTGTLTAGSYDQFGNSCGCTPTWSSRDAGVASVDGNGVVTAVGNGATWIVADVSGVLDSAFVEVVAGGRVATWLGGTAGAEQDWHTASNWSIGVVPGAEDTVLVPAAVTHLPVMSADAYIAGYGSEADALLILNGTVTLTVHGSAVADGAIVASGAGNVLFDVAGSTIAGGFPVLSIFADVVQSGPVSAVSVYVNQGSLSPAGQGLVVSDRLEVVGGTLWMTDPADVVQVAGPAVFVDGQPAGTLTAGTFLAMSDLTNIGACGQFVATGTTFVLGGDTANVALDCPSALFDGNRFAHLTTTGGIDQQIFFNTHIIAERFTAFGGSANVTLHGVATPIVARVIEVNDATLDRLQLKQQTTSNLDGLNLLGVTFTGFAGTSLTQLEVSRPGDAPIFVSATFDEGSDGQYIDATDSDGIAPFVEMHVESPSIGGPARTTTSGGAMVWWTGQPYAVVVIGGNGQSGNEGIALTDSLYVNVHDVFATPVPDATVTWTVTGGGGSVSPAIALSDVNGDAATSWTLGPAFTTQSVEASVAGAAIAAPFSATSVAGAPGATIVWTGAAGSDWNDTGNWSPARLPAASDTAFIPTAAPIQPILTAPVTVAGLMVDSLGASLGIGAHDLTVTSLLVADAGIGGTGTVHFGDTEVRGNNTESVVQLPAFDVAGQTFLWNRVSVAGDATVLANGYLELTFGGLQTTGDVTVAGDNSYLGVFDSLLVGGSLTVGGTESAGVAHLENRETIVVTDSFHVAGRGLVEFGNASNTLRIGGNARWVSTEPAEGWQPVGIVEIAGDWYQDGPSFHSPALQTFFNGTTAPQTVTHLNAGHGPGQGHFGPVHVSNPNGLTFLTPSLIRGELTSDAGVPIGIDSLLIEGHVVASGDVTFTYLDTRSASVSGALAGTTLRTAGIPSAASFAVDTTIYRTPDIETRTATVNSSLPYTVLTLESDSTVFDGAASISGRMTVLGVTTLGGRTTAGEVAVDGPGELDLAGHTLDATGGSVAVGASSGTGIIPMDAATDSIIAEQVTFVGSSSEGRMSAGTIVATGFTADGLAFNATAGHTVVLDPRGGVVTNQITTTTPSIVDGLGARFGTLHVVGSAGTGVELNSDVAALNFVSDPGVLLVAAPGAQHAVLSDETHVDGTTFRNVPLQVLGLNLPLAIDNSTFEQFDAGSTQLEITHDATQAFLFTNMAFDSIADADPAADQYLRATKTGLIDGILDIEITATNIDNGGDRTITTGPVNVVWTNDAARTPPPPATIAWLGEISTEWFDGANWSDGVGPTGADTVHVFADAPFQPVLNGQDSIAGIILEPTASLTLNATLVVFDHVQAGNTIVGPASMRVHGGSISGTVPTLEVAGTVSVAAPLTIDGDLLYVEDNATLYAFFPTTITGSAYLDRDGAHLLVADVMNIAGSVEVGALGAVTIPELDVSSSLTVGLHLTTVESGFVELATPASHLVVAGNASFLGTFPTEGFLTQGLIEVAGDWTSDGDAFRSTGTAVVLNGTLGLQTVTVTDGGTGAGQGAFADLTIDNPNGVDMSPSPIVAVDGNLVVTSGALSAAMLQVAGSVTNASVLTATTTWLKALSNTGTWNVGWTIYFSEAGDPQTVVSSAVTYTSLSVIAEDAVSDGPLVTDNLYVGDIAFTAPVRFALVDQLNVNNLLEVTSEGTSVSRFVPNGNAVAVGGDLQVSNGGVVHLTQPGENVTVGGNAVFAGTEPTDTTFTAGTVSVGGDVSGAGTGFQVAGTQFILFGANPQTIQLTDPGVGAGQARFAGLNVNKSGGAGVTLASDVVVTGDLDETSGLAIAGPHTVRVLGHVDLGGRIVADSLQVGGAYLNVGDSLGAGVTEFFGAGQQMPALCCYQSVLVSGNVSSSLSPVAIARHLTVTGNLDLQGDVEVDSILTVAGTVQLGGHALGARDVNVVAFGFDMSDPLDALFVRGGSVNFFQPSVSSLIDGQVVVEAPGNFYSQGDAFRSLGTALVMQGDTLFMDAPGASDGLGLLTALAIESPSFVVMDSVYVAGSVTGAGANGVVDRGQVEGGAWFGEFRVDGDILAPTTGFTFSKIAVSGDLQIDYNAMDVDTVQFTGNGQVARTEDPNDFSNIPYSTILITGPNVSLGGGTDYTNLASDVIVRGAGVSALLTSNDDGTIGSLRIEDADASTTVGFSGFGWSVQDSIVIASGALVVADQLVQVNTFNSAATAIRTTGTGVVSMADPSGALTAVSGDVRFEGGSTDGLLTAGAIELGAGAAFYSVNDAFAASGTQLIHRGDTISMRNAGPAAGQGRLSYLRYGGGSPELEVADSLYIDGDLHDTFGYMLHDQGDDALVVVTGDVVTDSSQVVVDHVVIGGNLVLSSQSNWAVDTTTFNGNGQVAPVVVNDGFTPVPYNNVVFRGGGAIDFGTAVDYLDQAGAHLHVRDAGTTVSIYSSDNGHVGSVVMSEGDALQRVNFVNDVNVWDSVHVASGVLGMSSVGVTANYNGVAPVALRTTGTGIIELNEPLDQLYVPNGDVWFEGGQSVLSNGIFWHEVTPQFVVGVGIVSGTFHATGAAYQSSGTYTRLDVDTIVVVDGGPGVSQARFDKLEFYSGDLNTPTWIDGHAYVADSLIAAFSFSELNGTPGSQLTVVGGMATGSTYLQMPLLTVHGVLNGYQFGYNVDVTEFAGSGQAISQVLPFDTILVTGSATRTVQIGVTDTIARVVLVENGGVLGMAGGTGTQMMITDSLVIDGVGSVFDLNGTNMIVGGFAGDGGLVTSNGGIIASQIFGYLSLNGSAEFRGGDTEARLTDGLFYFNGDFYAENGAFQASGNHESYFSGGAGSPTIRFATPGATSGSDHFGHLTIATGGVVNIASDIYALGDFDDGSDPTSTIIGSGVETIYSDGWDFGGGLIVQDVTLELNEDLAPAAGTTTLFGLTFAGYPSGTGATRMRIRHPGLLGSATLQFDNVDFSATGSDPGLYVHAIDSDAAGANPDVLNIVYYFAFTSEPGDFFSRIQEDDGATIGTNTP